ncbi:MAG TPA: HDOD domain-containing protein [Acidimicrobiales bacterium]|nr:HDOD domain-containing protein [Acidimicrobiales bacterium]
MVTVLFVDDDAAGLRALRDAYERCHDGWETCFIPRPGDALDAMSERHIDAVVASARLSGMSTASFLRVAKQQHPRTARIALSNPGDRSAKLGALPVVNQCLSKTCGPDVLVKVVERTTRLHERIFSEATQRLVSEVGSLPSLPSNLLALDCALSDENCSLGQIADIMSSDVAMVAKVLQLVNSSFFGLRTDIHDLRQAVAYLGIETLRDFAMAGAVFRAFSPSRLLPDSWLGAFNAHSLAVADVTASLVRTSLARCEANVAGMLHNVGELVVADRAPERLKAIAADVAEGFGAGESERRHLGTTLPVVGGYLLAVWGMNYHIVEAITCQRETCEGPAREPELGDLVRTGDYLGAAEPGGEPHCSQAGDVPVCFSVLASDRSAVHASYGDISIRSN